MNQKHYHVEKSGFLDMKITDIKVLHVVKKYVEYGFRTVLVVTLLITGFTLLTSNTDLIGIKSFTVLSGSMTPTIPVGSIIYTHKNLGYNLGDIITFKNNGGETVSHRVYSIKNNGEVVYITKGDANKSADEGAITADKIIGKTYFFIPYIGRVGEFIKTPKGLFLAVFLPALLIIGFELWNIKKEIEKAVEQRILNKLKQEGGAHPHSLLWPDSTS